MNRGSGRRLHVVRWVIGSVIAGLPVLFLFVGFDAVTPRTVEAAASCAELNGNITQMAVKLAAGANPDEVMGEISANGGRIASFDGQTYRVDVDHDGAGPLSYNLNTDPQIAAVTVSATTCK